MVKRLDLTSNCIAASLLLSAFCVLDSYPGSTLVSNIRIFNSFSTCPATLGSPELGYIFSMMSMEVGRLGIKFRGVFRTGAERARLRMAVSFIVLFGCDVSHLNVRLRMAGAYLLE
jgi:hypothetical protein